VAYHGLICARNISPATISRARMAQRLQRQTRLLSSIISARRAISFPKLDGEHAARNACCMEQWATRLSRHAPRTTRNCLPTTAAPACGLCLFHIPMHICCYHGEQNAITCSFASLVIVNVANKARHARGCTAPRGAASAPATPRCAYVTATHYYHVYKTHEPHSSCPFRGHGPLGCCLAVPRGHCAAARLLPGCAAERVAVRGALPASRT